MRSLDRFMDQLKHPMPGREAVTPGLARLRRSARTTTSKHTKLCGAFGDSVGKKWSFREARLPMASGLDSVLIGVLGIHVGI